MKIRFTLGNVIGLLTTAGGFIADHKAVIEALATPGGRAVAAGALIGWLTKSVLSHNSQDIPEEKKVVVGPLMFEKTGLLKP